MMIIKRQLKYRRFKIYIRPCRRCEELGKEDFYFETENQLSRFCPTCKEIIIKEKIEKSLKARGLERKNVPEQLNK
jgi:hypothetical protein